MENTQSAAGRFGTEGQAMAILSQQRRESADTVTKSDVIVVCSPTNLSTKEVMSLSADGQDLHTSSLDYPVLNRMFELLKALNVDSQLLNIFGPHSGVPCAIADRVAVDKSDVKIVTHTVNKNSTDLWGMFSAALTNVRDIDQVFARFGVHALMIVDQSKSHDVVTAIVGQYTKSVKSLAELSSVNDSTLDSETLDVTKLPGNPYVVMCATNRTFIIQNERGILYTLSDEETQMQNVPFEKVIELLQLEGVATANRSEADLRALYQDIVSQKADAQGETSEEGPDLDLDAEDEEDEEDAPTTLGELLTAFDLPRHCYRALAFSLSIVVLKKDEVADIINKIEDHAVESDLDVVSLLETFVPMIEDRQTDAQPVIDYLSALSEADEEEEDEEDSSDEDDGAEGDDEPDEDDESDDESDDDSDEEDEEDEESEDEDEGEMEFDEEDEDEEDVESLFERPGTELTNDERTVALAVIGEDVSGLNTVQVLRKYNEVRSQVLLAAQSTEQELTDAEEEFEADEDGDDDESDNDIELSDQLGAMSEEALVYLANHLGVQAGEEDGIDYLADVIIENLTFESMVTLGQTLGLAEEDLTAEDEDDQHAVVMYILDNLDVADLEADDDSDAAFIEAESESTLGSLLQIKSSGALVINFVLVEDRDTLQHLDELAEYQGVNYRFPFNLGNNGAVGAMIEPADRMIEALESVQQSTALIERDRFNSRDYARRLTSLLNEQIQATLYGDRVEDGLDPRSYGPIVGDFEADDEDGEDLNAQYGLEGLMIPIADLYNAHVQSKPLFDTAVRTMLTTGVLNVAIPGFWAISKVEAAGSMIEKAVNAVQSLVAEKTDLEVYAAFTFTQGSVLTSDLMFNAFTTLRNTEGAMHFTSEEAQMFDTTPNVLEVADAIGRPNLPLTLLSGGAATSCFDLGGDNTIVIPCFEVDYDDVEEDEEEDE